MSPAASKGGTRERELSAHLRADCARPGCRTQPAVRHAALPRVEHADPTARVLRPGAGREGLLRVERGRGGVGLIIQGGTFVSPESDYTNLWQMFSDGCVDAWAPIVDAVQSEGTTMFVQLLHAGHHGDKRGLNGGPKSASNVPPIDGTGIGAGYAPLPVPVKPMSKADIRATVADFAAVHAARESRRLPRRRAAREPQLSQRAVLFAVLQQAHR